MRYCALVDCQGRLCRPRSGAGRANVTLRRPSITSAPTSALSLFPILHILILLSIFAVTHNGASAQALQRIPVSESDRRAADDTASWALGRITGLSNTSVTAKLLADVPGAAASFHALDQFMEDAISESDCSLSGQSEWFRSLDTFSALRGWPMVDKICASSTKNRPLDRRKFSAAEVLSMLRGINRAMNTVKNDVVQATLGNFSNPVIPESWLYKEGKFTRCIVEKAFGVRYRPANSSASQWHYGTEVTNGKVDANFPDWERQFVTEFVGADSDSNFVPPLGMRLHPWPGRGNEDALTKTTARQLFTTSFDKWAWQAGLSPMISLRPADVPAVPIAIRLAEAGSKLTIDSTTPSNLASLALPMVLSIVPLSLFADCGTFSLLLYTLLTDILTTVPFIIKGLELISLGTNTYSADVTNFAGLQFYDPNLEKSAAVKNPRDDAPWVVSEVWVCECRLESVRSIGIAFCSIGIAFIVIGVVFEWQARVFRMRWAAKRALNKPNDDFVKAALLQSHFQAFEGISQDMASNPGVLDEAQQFVRYQNPLPTVDLIATLPCNNRPKIEDTVDPLE